MPGIRFCNAECRVQNAELIKTNNLWVKNVGTSLPDCPQKSPQIAFRGNN